MQLQFVVFAFFLSSLTLLTAQNNQPLSPCGTKDGRVTWLQEYQKSPQAYPRSVDVLYVPVTIHLVGKSDGTAFFQEVSVMEAFCTLNKDFEQAGIQFFIEGSFKYHANSTWYDHTFQQGAQMMSQKNVANTINCYFVGSPAGNCGYSSYNLGIALAKSCSNADSHTWAHEIGHYLSLPHPFYGWEGSEHDYSQPAPEFINGNPVEKLDGSNCSTAADGFCDTPVDYLNYRWACDLQGFSNVTQKDPSGASFESDGTLFMSYSLDACANRFSDEQIAAMQANLLTERNNLLYNQIPMEPVSADGFSVLYPMEGDTVDNFQEVTFAWEPVEHAQGYFLEITVIPNFQAVLFRHRLNQPFFTTTELKKNKNYYWRVRPYNRWHTCNQLTEIFSFRTGEIETVTGINNLDALTDLVIAPNPVPAGQDILLHMDMPQSMELECSLNTLTGRPVYQNRRQVSGGTQTLSIPGKGLPAGLYVLHLRSENLTLSRKIIIGH